MKAMLRILPALFCLLVPVGCGARGDAGTPDMPRVEVRTALATTQPFTETVGTIGTVVPRPGHVAALGAPAPTRIMRILVTTGQRVTAGDTLVVLDRSTFEATAASAEAVLAAAERSHERATRLAEAGVVPRKELDQATADLARARADVVTARRAKELSVLRAPIGGVVTRLNAMLGAAADPSQPLVELADPSALDVLLNVTPSEAGRVKIGGAVELSAGQSAGGEPLGTGRVLEVAGTVDSATRAVTVRVQVPASRRPLRIGETVYGLVVVSIRDDALTVPLEALVPAGEGYRVFVVDSSGVAHARPVTIGGRSASLAEITAGLSAGDRVITYGAYGVDEGTRVTELKR